MLNEKFICYKCGSPDQLLIEETIDNETKKIITKKFICFSCSTPLHFMKEEK